LTTSSTDRPRRGRHRRGFSRPPCLLPPNCQRHILLPLAQTLSRPSTACPPQRPGPAAPQEFLRPCWEEEKNSAASVAAAGPRVNRVAHRASMWRWILGPIGAAGALALGGFYAGAKFNGPAPRHGCSDEEGNRRPSLEGSTPSASSSACSLSSSSRSTSERLPERPCDGRPEAPRPTDDFEPHRRALRARSKHKRPPLPPSDAPLPRHARPS